MASKLQIKVFNPQGEYVAAFQYAEDAGVLVAAYGNGATARLGHSKKDTFWTEGVDGRAGDSYDQLVAARNALVAKLRAQWEQQRLASEERWRARQAAQSSSGDAPK